MTNRTFRRAGGPGRRTPRIRRASAGLTPVRAGAALAMLLSAGAIYGLAATSAFGFGKLEIKGSTITPEAAVRETLALTDGENLFEIATDPLEARLLEIPAIAGVEISIGLPDTVAVRIEERQPILVWQAAERRFLVDRAGFLFAGLGETATIPAGLPLIVDERRSARKLAVGESVDAVGLDAATRLASLTPAAIGSGASALAVGVTDANGFVLRSVPESWIAVFGFYGPSVRTTELVPGQVQALRELLAEVGEATVAQVILGDDRKGTYTPKESPRGSASPAP